MARDRLDPGGPVSLDLGVRAGDDLAGDPRFSLQAGGAGSEPGRRADRRPPYRPAPGPSWRRRSSRRRRAEAARLVRRRSAGSLALARFAFSGARGEATRCLARQRGQRSISSGIRGLKPAPQRLHRYILPLLLMTVALPHPMALAAVNQLNEASVETRADCITDPALRKRPISPSLGLPCIGNLTPPGEESPGGACCGPDRLATGPHAIRGG